MQIHSDPDPGQTLKSQKVELLHEKLYFTVIGQKTFIRTVLQIRDVDPESEVFYLGSRALKIPEPHPHQPKKLFLSSRKYDPVCSSRIRDSGMKKALDPGPGSATLPTKAFFVNFGQFPDPDPGQLNYCGFRSTTMVKK
jgi:hypothetical protein